MSSDIAAQGADADRRPDLCVVGAGVVGCAVAWRAGRAGLRVVLVDPRPGAGASGVAAGMLAPVGEAAYGEAALLALNLEAQRRYPAFIAELEAASGTHTGYLETGTLLVARDGDDAAALQREQELRARSGLDAARLTARECRALEPGLAASVRGGVRMRGDHQVDPRLLLEALLRACRVEGVMVVAHRASVIIEDDAVAGVRTDDGGTIRCDRVVLAAGAWSARIDGVPPGTAPPVRPVKGVILRVRAATPIISHVVRGFEVYLVPRADGTIVIGATVEERGFETSVSAGAVHDLLRDARELVPDTAECELIEVSAGLRPGSPDNTPLVGATDVHGLLLATGHYRNGVLQAPLTADAITDLLMGRDAPAAVLPCSPLRFSRHPEAVA